MKIKVLEPISMPDVVKKFNEEYEFLYDNNDRVAGYNEALQFGDKFIADERNRDFVRAFNKARGDLITSDREVVAFAFTLDDFGLI